MTGSSRERFGAAVVTGAAQGIGHAIASALHNAGYRVVWVDRNKAALEAVEREFPGAHVLAGDASEWDTHERAAQLAAGDLRLWVNNASAETKSTPAHLIEPDEIRSDIDATLLPFMFGTSVAVRSLLALGTAGAIVNVGSIQGFKAFEGYYTYQAAKAAIVMLSRGVARDYAAAGIRCSVVSPGTIVTPSTKLTMLRKGESEEAAAASIPLGRFGHAAEVAEAVLFLASHEYITGSELVIDGGATL